MSKKHSLEVKNDVNKRFGQLATTPCLSAYKPKKTKMLDDKRNSVQDINKMHGRKSYSQIAKEQGLYISICSAISAYRQANRDSSFSDFYEYIHAAFPTVFKNPTMYSGNVAKIIASDKGWSQAYFSRSLVELAEYRMREVLNSESLLDSEKMTAYEKVMKIELAKKELFENTGEEQDNKVEFNVNISVEEDEDAN